MHDAMKTYGRVEVQLHAFFTSALVEMSGHDAEAALPKAKEG
jgi:hypothetical protein